MQLTIRKATIADIPALDELIAASVRGLGVNYYSPDQIEAALQGTFGVDSELIRDETYFVAESQGEIMGCGGWSLRRTLYGSDSFAGRQSERLDPTSEPARIRAFFVHPDHARKGVGTQILEACENAARTHGFTAATLLATLPGHPFYLKYGYEDVERKAYDHVGGITLDFITMRKSLG